MGYLLSALAKPKFKFPGFKLKMDKAEAKLILNITKQTPDANENYKRLMLIYHPEKYGSEYLAYKIKEAKNIWK